MLVIVPQISVTVLKILKLTLACSTCFNKKLQCTSAFLTKLGPKTAAVVWA